MPAHHEDPWSEALVDAAIKVHRCLGPGLLESPYTTCLAHELRIRGVPVQREVPLPIEYMGMRLDAGYRLDLLIDGVLVAEVKSVARLLPIHEAQMLTYLKLSGAPVGLLMNFNVVLMKDGIRRMVQGFRARQSGRIGS